LVEARGSKTLRISDVGYAARLVLGVRVLN